MRTLFQFLYRIRILFLFIALEAVAFVWIYNARSYQRSVFLNSTNEVSGSLLSQTTHLYQYLHLREQNELLARENARLHGLTKNAYLPIYHQNQEKNDTGYQNRYSYQQAQLVSSSFRKARNFMTVNRGSLHGIKPGMGVIGSKGIVGVTQDVSPHFSTVIPLINPFFSVSGMIKGTGFFGPVKWSTPDYRYAYLTDIARYANFLPGDTVLTDARSQVFPGGIPIGYIESHKLQEDQNFFKIKLRLATDFASVNHVYIITDKMKKELQELQELAPN
ncbi:MAG: rod shape-determining protein MreC [Owenweeksia sp.]|nr:rod shape-determining protein MreC [Owenweeksia sp.]